MTAEQALALIDSLSADKPVTRGTFGRARTIDAKDFIAALPEHDADVYEAVAALERAGTIRLWGSRRGDRHVSYIDRVLA